jgi:hypothetical protein
MKMLTPLKTKQSKALNSLFELPGKQRNHSSPGAPKWHAGAFLFAAMKSGKGFTLTGIKTTFKTMFT